MVKNRVTSRTDRAGNQWFTNYNGLGYKTDEIDGAGRLTHYDVGAFGQISGMTLSGGDQTYRKGNLSHQEVSTFDWLGRKNRRYRQLWQGDLLHL